MEAARAVMEERKKISNATARFINPQKDIEPRRSRRNPYKRFAFIGDVSLKKGRKGFSPCPSCSSWLTAGSVPMHEWSKPVILYM
jgi:hypothetical protein